MGGFESIPPDTGKVAAEIPLKSVSISSLASLRLGVRHNIVENWPAKYLQNGDGEDYEKRALVQGRP
jgi:hypothetical protein